MHYMEALDALANVAKATGSYNVYANTVLMVAAIVLAEIPDPQEVEKAIGNMRKQYMGFRAQNEAEKQAAANPQGAH